ncbi:hypothetical protein [Gilliamella sp. B2785]|uniref:hypothetical protein n=1 Tax=Gilliamella sp. B2785 TaxID=2817982 RepID=UPI00226AB48C|nr:hypothetical protein [Gilliamella sp. B2785]
MSNPPLPAYIPDWSVTLAQSLFIFVELVEAFTMLVPSQEKLPLAFFVIMVSILFRLDI